MPPIGLFQDQSLSATFVTVTLLRARFRGSPPSWAVFRVAAMLVPKFLPQIGSALNRGSNPRFVELIE
jgi:hypothetical protein